MTTMLKSLRKERNETGEAAPDLETAVKMADFFGVSLDEFVGREGDYQK